MPELPEVETTRRSVAPSVVGRRIAKLHVYDPRLRWPVPGDLQKRLEGRIVEELSRRSLTGFNSSVHTIVAHYLLNHGTPAQKAKYLPRLCRGELVGAIAMTEPGAGSDLQGMRTRASLSADKSHYLVNGSKTSALAAVSK